MRLQPSEAVIVNAGTWQRGRLSKMASASIAESSSAVDALKLAMVKTVAATCHLSSLQPGTQRYWEAHLKHRLSEEHAFG